VKRHLAHEGDRVVERPQKYVNGLVVRVVIEEAQTAASHPWIRVGDGGDLHSGDWKFRDELIALLVGQRVPPTEERTYHIRLGAGRHPTIKHGFGAVPHLRSLSPQELPHRPFAR
jgi:hypothetical protein